MPNLLRSSDILQYLIWERRMLRLVLAGLIVLLGLALSVGGAWLVSLGGSWFYLLLGLGLLLSGVLLAKEEPAALSIYGMALLATLVWGLWDVGLDWWALVPRGALLVVIGILLLPIAHRWYRLSERFPGRSLVGPAGALMPRC